MKLLVTSFPPYDQFKTNSSQILIESMIQKLHESLADHRGRLIFEILDFDNASPKKQRQTMTQNLLHLLGEHQSDVCLLCGQAHVPLAESQAVESGSDEPFMSLEMSRRALTMVMFHVNECMS